MKKILCFLAVASTMLMASCGSDDSTSTTTPPVGGGDDNGNGGNNPGVTAIVLTVDAASKPAGQTFTFTVKNNLGATVTSSSTYTVDGVAIIGNTFSTEVAGTYEVEATNNGLVSNKLNITVTAIPTATDASDSFIVNGVNYETPFLDFAYRGIFSETTSSTGFVIVWDYNPYLAEGNQENPSYPNDLYISIVQEISPSGTNEDNQPTFSLLGNTPGTGSYIVSNTFPSIGGAAGVYGSTNEFASGATGNVADATVTISSMNFPDPEAIAGTIESTYSVTLTDGTILTGEFSGEFGWYNASQAARAQRNSNAVLTVNKNNTFDLSKMVKLSN